MPDRTQVPARRTAFDMHTVHSAPERLRDLIGRESRHPVLFFAGAIAHGTLSASLPSASPRTAKPGGPRLATPRYELAATCARSMFSTAARLSAGT